MHLAAEQFVTNCCHSSDPKSCSLSKWVRAGGGPGTNETRGSELQSVVLHREEFRACGSYWGMLCSEGLCCLWKHDMEEKKKYSGLFTRKQ